MTESSRTQGLLICGGSALAGVIFLIGLLVKSWWAVAIPVGVLLAFVLGLTFWVGWTIATIQVEPEPDPDAKPAAAASSTEPRS
ncbi:MAG TPA: hypothetical protein VNE71_11410 [Myxococcota bacterium]|nr:hypothetical protein [Myxococcota bacterium]